MSAPAAIEIRSISGAIAALPSADTTAQIDAIKHVEAGAEAADVRIVTVEHEDGVLVCVLQRDDPDSDCRPGGVSARDDAGDQDDDRHGDVRVRTDFTVRVPAGVRLVATTMNGELSAVDLASDVHLATMNGAVLARTTGTIEAQTMNGAIEATVRGERGPNVLETMNGDVSVTFPEAMGASVHASTMRGSIDADFALAESSGYGPSEASARLGDGRVSIQASTMNGDVSLHRSGHGAESGRPTEDE
jgi:hypothetical protein